MIPDSEGEAFRTPSGFGQVEHHEVTAVLSWIGDGDIEMFPASIGRRPNKSVSQIHRPFAGFTWQPAGEWESVKVEEVRIWALPCRAFRNPLSVPRCS